jgi:hypothetical protein
MEQTKNTQLIEQRVMSMDKFEFGKASNRVTLNFWSVAELEAKLKGLADLQKNGIMPAEE